MALVLWLAVVAMAMLQCPAAWTGAPQDNPCQALPLWPLPAACHLPTAPGLRLVLAEAEALVVSSNFSGDSAVWRGAVERLRSSLAHRAVHRQRGPIEPHLVNTTLPVPPAATGEAAFGEVKVFVGDPSAQGKVVGVTDEGYTLAASRHGVNITAPTLWGALYGLDTLAQLVAFNETRGVHAIPTSPLTIHDHPRYPYRGLLIDTANRYLSVPTIRAVVAAMADLRFSVLHWHIVGSFSFPFVSAKHPILAQRGAWADGAVYTRGDVEGVVAFAKARGVTVLFELDVPGHTYAWGLGYPNVTIPCPPLPSVDIGAVNSVPINPAEPFAFALAADLIAELHALSPHRFFHLGGDELQTACWAASDAVRAFMKEKGFKTTAELQAWTEARLIAALPTAAPAPRPIVWEDTFQAVPSALPASTVVEVWSDASVVRQATSSGHDVILADGWYLDRQVPVDGQTGWFWADTWAQMYSVEPQRLVDPSAKGKVLGGEANMWSEQVSDSSIMARIWPRAFGISERLWSPREVTNPGLAAQRLAKARCRLAYDHGFGPIWSDYCGAEHAPGQAPVLESRDTTSSSQLVGVIWASLIGGAVFGAAAMWWMGFGREQPAGTSTPAASTRRSQRAVAGAGGGVSDTDPLLTPSVDLSLQRTTSSGGERPSTVLALTSSSTRERVKALDVFRGLTIALMIFVDEAGQDFPEIDHCPWAGVRLADFVEPGFDFVVGVSIALSMKKFELDGSGSKRPAALAKATRRFLKLFLLGVVTQGGVSLLSFNLSRIRVFGILQRVAVCFYAVALMEIYLPRLPVVIHEGLSSWQTFVRCLRRYAWHWVCGLVLLGIHTAILYGIDVPPAYGERCGRGVLTPACNAATYVDVHVLTTAHMYFPSNGGGDFPGMTYQRLPACSTCAPGQCTPPPDAPLWCSEGPFDPEGLVSSLTAILASVFGVHYGHQLFLVKSPAARLRQWVPFSAAQLALGLLLHYTLVEMNMNLYSISFVLVSDGAVGLVLSFCYWLVDIRKRLSSLWLPFMMLGMNPISIFVLAECGIVSTPLTWFYLDGNPDKNLANILWPSGVYWGQPDTPLPTKATHDWKVMLWTIGYITIWMVVAWIMFRKRIFIKI